MLAKIYNVKEEKKKYIFFFVYILDIRIIFTLIDINHTDKNSVTMSVMIGKFYCVNYIV